MKKTSRVTSAFLAAVLLLTLVSAQAMAADAKATTLRLEEIEGTVSVFNARGKALTAKAGSKLYNGYTVSTAASGYAWISLDDDVVVKLDVSSKATIKQDGKKLEVQLENGNLLFNVSKPLDQDASLDIRTSSMSTGVRGTAGLVSVSESSRSGVDSAGQSVYTYVAASRLVILEGTVTLTYSDAPIAASGQTGAGNELATAQITSGWQADVLKTTSVVAAGASSSTSVRAEVQPVSIRDTLLSSGYAAVEITADSALMERMIGADTDMDQEAAAEVAGNAGARLEQEKNAAGELAQAADEAAEKAAQEEWKDMKKEGDGANNQPIISVFPPSEPQHSGASDTDQTPTPPSVMRTVTYKYQSGPIATRTVADGSAVAAPSLQPTRNGRWELDGEPYDFSQPVTGDLTLDWVPAP
ncbi:MAG: hypothetical protein EOM52_00595 [Clostridia bacterium]|nr:hypothetical protein [Clostridia bacterium]